MLIFHTEIIFPRLGSIFSCSKSENCSIVVLLQTDNCNVYCFNLGKLRAVDEGKFSTVIIGQVLMLMMMMMIMLLCARRNFYMVQYHIM